MKYLRMLAWLSGIMILVNAILFLVPLARGHEAPSGFTYPYECCGSGDCAPAEYVGTDKDGRMIVNTKHHSGVWPYANPQVSVRPSPDGKVHLCATPDKAVGKDGKRTIYCLFLPDAS